MMMATEEVDCLSALHAVFHELQLVRVQRRPKGPPDNRHPRYELLLGDLHSRPELRNSYRPTAFQTPLLRADQVSTRSSDLSSIRAKGSGSDQFIEFFNYPNPSSSVDLGWNHCHGNG
jgi:hypothetical protein